MKNNLSYLLLISTTLYAPKTTPIAYSKVQLPIKIIITQEDSLREMLVDMLHREGIQSIPKNTDINETIKQYDYSGHTPLTALCSNFFHRYIHLLNSTSLTSRTIYHKKQKEFLQSITKLLEYGADTKKTDDYGQSIVSILNKEWEKKESQKPYVAFNKSSLLYLIENIITEHQKKT